LVRPAILSLVLASLLGCAGVSSDSNKNSPPPTSGGGGGGGSSPGQATVISTQAGARIQGVDITVPAPSNGNANAELLGTGDTASNTGSTIRRGATTRVILFGSGLTGSMQVRVSGPPDITVTDVQSIRSTNGTEGIAFNAAVSSDAGLGARSVYLQSGSDITVFAGGLEVVQ